MFFFSQYINSQTVGSITPAKRNDSVGGKIAQTCKASIRKAIEGTVYLMLGLMS